MPTSILEDSEHLKKGGKSTLKLLFFLGLTILIYLSSNIESAITWLKDKRASEVSSEFIMSKPEELSFLLPPTSKPRTSSEKKERKDKIVKNMNEWTEQILNQGEGRRMGKTDDNMKIETNQKTYDKENARKLENIKTPDGLIKSAVKLGLVHPREYYALVQEANGFGLYLNQMNQWEANIDNVTIEEEGQYLE